MLVELTDAHLPALLALSTAASWNQDLADWTAMLRRGRGWGIVVDDDDGSGGPTLVASTMVLPYNASPAAAAATPTLSVESPCGNDVAAAFAWVSMVLVLPAHRRHGHARRLLDHALADLDRDGRAAVLDATPAGHGVYRAAGFVDDWGFTRWRRATGANTGARAGARTGADTGAVAGAHTGAVAGGRDAGRSAARSAGGARLRAVDANDWPAIAALDAAVFGADRTPLLRDLAARAPRCALVADAGDTVGGYVFGRPGRSAAQVGPLVAADDATATTLLDAALAAIGGAAVVVDLVDERAAVADALRTRGFAVERPFTRMVRGSPRAPGDRTALVLVAGPELG